MKKAKSFLLFDDDVDDALLFKEILENLNAPVAFQHAQNGVEAIDLLQKEVYAARCYFPRSQYAAHGWQRVPGKFKKR